MTKYHSGGLTVEGLRKECSALQNHDEVKLTHLQGANVELVINNEHHVNQADYADIGGDLTKIPELVFVPINGPGDLVIANSEMTERNGYFIFDEILYIGNNEQEVFGYGILP